MLYIAIGILGATVMPHNFIYTVALYKPEITPELRRKKEAIKFATIDSTFSLFLHFSSMQLFLL
jgi:manganese transport protein